MCRQVAPAISPMHQRRHGAQDAVHEHGSDDPRILTPECDQGAREPDLDDADAARRDRERAEQAYQ